MSETPEVQKRSRWGANSLAAFLVFVVYPLSLGPAWRVLTQNDPLGNSVLWTAFRVVYYPLTLISKALGGWPQWFYDYLTWWQHH